MPQLKSIMDIFKLLNKSNCRECNEKTCLAFASSVFQGKKQLNECPHLDAAVLKEVQGDFDKQNPIEKEQDRMIHALKQEICKTDLAHRAEKIGGKYKNNKLVLKVLGKNFSVHHDGVLETDIHTNAWVTIPLLNYVLNCEGLPLANKWVPFRELKNGQAWERFFQKQCEIPFKKVADTYTDLFKDLIDIFNGQKVEDVYESDVALVLHPLPKVPILIRYWEPEGGLESELNLFFDENAEANCSIEALYTLGTGIVKMFEKLALTHGGMVSHISLAN